MVLVALVTVTVQVLPLPPVVLRVVPLMLQPAVPTSVTAKLTAPSPEPPPLVSERGIP